MSPKPESIAPWQAAAPANSGASQITQTVRAGARVVIDATGCVVPPMHLTSTFASPDSARSAPTTNALGQPDAGPVARPLPNSRAVRARSSPRSGWRRSRWCRLPRPGGRESRASRLLRRHLSAVNALQARGELRVDFVDQTEARGARGRARAAPKLSGSRRRAIRCCASSTSARSRRRARRRRAGGRRQHLPVAGLAAAARARRRPRGALDHEVPERTQRRRRRGGDRRDRGARAEPGLVGQLSSALPARRSTAS